uniref:RRM domain-containing protein n=1 Tax=Anopheles atroparvus TaxID=41427 RepID=A0AAG5DS53_ANOAO
MAPRKEKAAIKKAANDSNSTKISPMKKQKFKAGCSKTAKLPPVGTVRSEESSGIMFIKHLPSGLLEKELKGFFGQFGAIKRVFVARSPRTNRSCGYGYVEFLYEEVAKIASSAVNNYLMFGRSLKASVVPKRFSRAPRNLIRGLGKHGEPIENNFAWVQNQIIDKNGFVGRERLRLLRQRQNLKLQRALKELEQANLELPDVQECFVKVTDVCRIEMERVAHASLATSGNDGVGSLEEEEVLTALQPFDWVEFDLKTNQNGEDAKGIEAATKKANLKAYTFKKQDEEAAKEAEPQKRAKRYAYADKVRSIPPKSNRVSK